MPVRVTAYFHAVSKPIFLLFLLKLLPDFSHLTSRLTPNVQLHEFFSSSEIIAFYVKFTLYIFIPSNVVPCVPFYHPIIQYCKNLLQHFVVGFCFYCLTEGSVITRLHLLSIVYGSVEVQKPWVSQEPICGTSNFDFIFSSLLIRLSRQIGPPKFV